jgi:ABC-type bacteriocin/lantibiotic exporter with double-glycine peptidase domain
MRYNTKSYPHKERSDCGVRALAAACGIPYAKAHKALAKAGRKKAQGTHPYQLVRAATSLGIACRMVSARPMKPTLKQFVRTFRTGRHLVISQTHALAVVNGIVVDANRSGARTRVILAYAINPTPNIPIPYTYDPNR